MSPLEFFQSLFITLTIFILYIAECQYTEIWNNPFTASSERNDWECSGTWNTEWSSACYIPFDDSPENGCLSGTCGLLCSVSGSAIWYMDRTTTITSYSSLQLEIAKIQTYDAEDPDQCQVKYRYGDSGSFSTLWTSPNTGTVDTFNSLWNLGTTGSFSTVTVRLYITADSSDCGDACYFDDVVLSGILTPSPTPSPTSFPTPAPTKQPTPG